MESKERCPRIPLGSWPKKVEISAEEMHLAYLHREMTGEPIQSWIRRMIRERWEINEDMKGSKVAETVEDAGDRASTVIARHTNGNGAKPRESDQIAGVGREIQTRFPGW